MSSTPEEDFENHIPNVTDEEVEAALRASGLVVSFWARLGAPDLFVVSFATQQGQIAPFVLTAVAARQLSRTLTTLGF